MRAKVEITHCKKYNASWNYVISYNDKPCAISSSAGRAGLIASYLEGIPVVLNDKSLTRTLDRMIVNHVS